MRYVKYIIERSFPMTLAIGITFLAYIAKINYITDNNLNDALTGIITAASLIIGFIGAILPVIFGMKDNSKVVVYLFHKDKERLFLKYIKSTIWSGLVLIMVSVVMYFQKSFESTFIHQYYFYLWIFCLTLFLGYTYRCVSRMLQLMFADDDAIKSQKRKEETPKMKAHNERTKTIKSEKSQCYQ